MNVTVGVVAYKWKNLKNNEQSRRILSRSFAILWNEFIQIRKTYRKFCIFVNSFYMISTDKIKALIAQGEGLHIEFKQSRDSLSRSAFESICAFLNRKGGTLLLGVKDNGTVEGIREDTISLQLKTLANDMNNPQVISPTTQIHTEVVDMDGKKIICIYVPESKQAHTHKGKYYDRNEEGDYVLNNHFLISNLYVRKQDGFSENRVFPHLRIDDFVDEDFDYVRKLIRLIKPEHPWVKMTNDEILRSAKMHLRDEQTGKEGYTLAAALVFGKPATLAMTCPIYKTDALCRKEDTNRYDDRDVVDCNLIQAYGRLMAFVRKHTPGYIDDLQRYGRDRKLEYSLYDGEYHATEP
jgi:ATP-dependent DNA helicase RecG